MNLCLRAGLLMDPISEASPATEPSRVCHHIPISIQCILHFALQSKLIKTYLYKIYMSHVYYYVF